MNFKQFAPNLFISTSPGFLDYNHEIVHGLLCAVDEIFSEALQTVPFSSCIVNIEYWENGPMCSKISDIHLIFLSSKNDYWAQWLFQFSHEYCHHLINGEMTGEITGLVWFEEIMCHTASLYHLRIMLNRWTESPDHRHRLNAHVLRDYPDAHIYVHSPLYRSLNHPEFLRDCLAALNEPKYHRNLYVAVAEMILPIFLENPHLWKIILHFGDMRKWKSLDELFEHLFVCADDSYSYHLVKLYNLFLH